MRVLQQLTDLVKEVSADFPWGAIINETDTQDGTAVVRELYNDLLVNIYKLLDITGQTATGIQDSESDGYQIIEALKRLPNELNDIEQILTLNSGVWSVPFDLTKLPNKYVFFARVTDDYEAGQFQGYGEPIPSYSFTSSGFSASDEVMVVIDQSGVRAYKVGGASDAPDEVFTVMGIPVTYNDKDILYYQENGALLTDAPKADYLEQVIRVDTGDATIILTDIFIVQGFALCCCYVPGTLEYKFFQLNVNSPTVSSELTVVGITIGSGTDYSPYFYADETYLYATNEANNSASDNLLTLLEYNSGTNTLTFVNTMPLDASFVKTTNGALKNKKLYTYVDGSFDSFDVNTGVKVALGNFNGANGNLFTFAGQVYFTAGEVAKIWV